MLTIDKRVIEAALADAAKLKNPRRWVNLRIQHGDVYLDFGTILSNGDREQPTMTRRYFITKDGTVDHTRIVHS